MERADIAATGTHEPRHAAPAPVIPRWEWRIFSRTALGPHLRPFVSGAAGSAGEEAYLLSPVSPHNVNLRGGRLEVKHLERRDQRGLEQWRPVLVAPFPIDDAAVRIACTAWGLPAPAAAARFYSAAQFVAAMVAANPQLRAITIRKKRTPLTVLDCHGEYAELVVEGVRWESVAFEDADPERVCAAVARLGFDTADNTSDPAALARIAGIVSTAHSE